MWKFKIYLKESNRLSIVYMIQSQKRMFQISVWVISNYLCRLYAINLTFTSRYQICWLKNSQALGEIQKRIKGETNCMPCLYNGNNCERINIAFPILVILLFNHYYPYIDITLIFLRSSYLLECLILNILISFFS